MIRPALSIFAGVHDNRPAAGVFKTWEDFADMLEEQAATPADPADKCATLCLSPATYPTGQLRRKAQAIDWNWFAADIDNKAGNRDGSTIVDIMLKCEHENLPFVIYTTTSSRTDAECFRLMFPLAGPIPAADFPDTWAAIAAWLGCVDPQTKDVSRLFVAPRRWQGADNQFLRSDVGEPLDVGAIVFAHPVTATRRTAKLSGFVSISGLKPIPPGQASLWGDIVSQDAVAKAQASPPGGRMFHFLVSTATRSMLKGFEITSRELAHIGHGLAATLNRPTFDIDRDAENALRYAISAYGEIKEAQFQAVRPTIPARWLKGAA